MGSIQREKQPSMQREDQTDHGNEPGTNSSESAKNYLSKSVVRESRTPRSVGTGGGRPLPVTRCGGGNIPAYSAQGVLENVELTGIIGDDHRVGQQADDRPDHGRLGDA